MSFCHDLLDLLVCGRIVKGMEMGCGRFILLCNVDYDIR